MNVAPTVALMFLSKPQEYYQLQEVVKNKKNTKNSENSVNIKEESQWGNQPWESPIWYSPFY